MEKLKKKEKKKKKKKVRAPPTNVGGALLFLAYPSDCPSVCPYAVVVTLT